MDRVCIMHIGTYANKTSDSFEDATPRKYLEELSLKNSIRYIDADKMTSGTKSYGAHMMKCYLLP